MAITNASITTTVGNVFVSVGNTAITTAYICNVTSSPITANLYLLPSGGTLATNCQIYSNLSIAAYDTYILEWERILLSDGDTLLGNASTESGLVATVSYTGI
jgi:hypothetical protein